jgi:V/A-type H+-transporting ATPase subunit C
MDYEKRTAVLDFHTYPPVGTDDWRYVFQSAQVRALELQMLTKPAFLDMANAENFQAAADLLSATEYAMPRSDKSSAEMENNLSLRRSAVRKLFADLILDKTIVKLFKTRDDFANLRLAVRRMLTDKPLGTDYNTDGNFPPEQFEQVFAEENYSELPDYMADASERAVLTYYKNKDIRRIDSAIDSAQSEYNLKQAHRISSIFLLALFRTQIDLTNIRTMLRLKFTESEQRNVFFKGGFIELDRLERGAELGYEALAPLFFATPYYHLVEAGAAYLNSEKSFLRIDQQCQEHLTGFLKSTAQITAGLQPVIAYLLLKENEIRTVRLILTAKKNNLDTKLILDRIS